MSRPGRRGGRGAEGLQSGARGATGDQSLGQPIRTLSRLQLATAGDKGAFVTKREVIITMVTSDVGDNHLYYP